MSDQDKSTDSKNSRPEGISTESSPAATGKTDVTKKKVTKKKTAKKASKKKSVKKATTKKKATAKKAPAKKRVPKKKASKKSSAKKVASDGATAREIEKQAVSNAIRAAVSAGGDLMKPNGEELPAEEAKVSAQNPAETPLPADPTEHSMDVKPGQNRDQTPADDEAARQVEKKAVNDAILAAVNASGSLLKPDTSDKPPKETSENAASGETVEPQTPAEPAVQVPPAVRTPTPPEAPTEETTPLLEPVQPSVEQQPRPAPLTATNQVDEPAGAELRTGPKKPQTPETKPGRHGLFRRILLIALSIVAALFLARILLSEFDYASLVPGFMQEKPTDQQRPAAMRPIPESQMQIIREVFAPELRQQ